MKKILFIITIILLILLIGFGIFYFFGGGKQAVDNFFQDNSFGTFFDIEPQSRNDFIPTGDSTNDSMIPSPQESAYVAPLLRQLSFEPVSGYTFYSTTSTSTRTSTSLEGAEIIEEFTATSTVFRFQERATGNIYDVFEFIQAPQKISPITEQKIYETQWSNNKNIFIFKKLVSNNEFIQTTLGELQFGTTTTDTSIKKSELSNIISDVILNKNTNKLVYSIKQGGSSVITTSNIDRTGEKPLKTLYFEDFTLDTINSTDVLITTKASQTAPGYAYTLNTTTGSFSKILGNITGLLVKVSPDKRFYIYSRSEIDRPQTLLLNTQNGFSVPLSFDTIPSEKCVFSQKESSAYCFGSLLYKKGQYPDDWYKGKILNYETLYKINLEDASITVLYNFQADNIDLDAFNVQLSNDEGFIVFQNKFDLTLWGLKL